MFSWEIERELQKYNHNLPVSKYNEICGINNNPQISRLRYNPYDGNYEMLTSDNCYFVFTMFKDFE